MVTQVSAPTATLSWSQANIGPANPVRISWTALQPGVVHARVLLTTIAGHTMTLLLSPVRFVGQRPVATNTVTPVTPAVINRAWAASPILPASAASAPSVAVASVGPWTAAEGQAIRRWSLHQGLDPVTVHPLASVPPTSSQSTPELLTSETAIDVLALSVSAPGAHVWLLPLSTLLNVWPTTLAQTLRDHHVQVLSISYGADLASTSALNQAWVTQWTHTVHALNAVGITVVVSAGDTGPYVGTSTASGVDPIGVSLLTSPAAVTVVGGADWRSQTSGHGFAVAYWGANTFAFLNSTTVASLVGLPDGLGNLLGSGGYSPWTPAPPWQQRFSGPATNGRGTPDFVGPASTDYPGWHPIVDQTPLSLGGTSFATPLSAGWIADCSALAGHGLGNINPALYALARTNPAAFVPARGGNNGIYHITPHSAWNPLVGLGAPRWATVCAGLRAMPSSTH